MDTFEWKPGTFLEPPPMSQEMRDQLALMRAEMERLGVPAVFRERPDLFPLPSGYTVERLEAEMAVQTTSSQPIQIRLRPKPAKPSKKGSKK